MSEQTHAPWKDESALREKYCAEGLTIAEIAEEWNTTFDTIRYYKDKFEIEGRPNGVSPKANELDASTLRQEYWENEKSLNEISEEYNCSEVYVLDRMKESGVERRVADHKREGAWEDAETLERLYWKEGLTTEEIGDQLGCSAGTVCNWMGRHDIDRELTPEEKPPYHHFGLDGYEKIKTKVDQETQTVLIHRLVAIANGKLEPSNFRNENIHVHHKNGVRWDNRPENLEVMSKSSHHSTHYEEREIGEDGQIIS